MAYSGRREGRSDAKGRDHVSKRVTGVTKQTETAKADGQSKKQRSKLKGTSPGTKEWKQTMSRASEAREDYDAEKEGAVCVAICVARESMSRGGPYESVWVCVLCVCSEDGGGANGWARRDERT